jgi:gluconate:H+ symporter, GntP family
MDPFLLLFIGIVIVIGGIVWLRMHAFVALLSAAIAVAALTPRSQVEQSVLAQGRPPAEATARAQETLGVKLAAKFGNTATNLGLLIAMASIVGVCLLHSGGADRIVRSVLALFGEKRSPLVFATSGLVLGVPVFFDTVFLLLIPLARALARRTGRNYLLYVLAIAVGTTMTHSLVPPTPGPLFAANALNVDVGVMMVGGLILSSMTAACGLLYAVWANRRWPVGVRSGPDDGAHGAGAVERPEQELPPLWLALAPIVLPVLLISGRTAAPFLGFPAPLAATFNTIGHPNIALAIAAAIALATVAWRSTSEKPLGATVQSALQDAGIIILITAAGGVFGGVLQETGVGERIKSLADAHRIAVLPLAFLVTALIRTAQGSATVAMVTAVGILGGFASPDVLGFHPLYLAMTIGCASKLIPWMNDSGFWVVCKTSGLTEREMLRSMSVMFTVMGVAGFLLCMIAARLFPLV